MIVVIYQPNWNSSRIADIFFFQMMGAVSLWNQVPVGSTLSDGTMILRPMPVPSSGTEAVRAVQITLRLKPPAGILASTRNILFRGKGVCRANRLHLCHSWIKWLRLYFSTGAQASSCCCHALWTTASEEDDGEQIWAFMQSFRLRSHCSPSCCLSGCTWCVIIVGKRCKDSFAAITPCPPKNKSFQSHFLFLLLSCCSDQQIM